MSKQFLEIGDKIQKFHLKNPYDYIYEISQTTKTLAKTKDGKSFKKEIIHNTTKPNENCIAEVYVKSDCPQGRYFLISKPSK